MLQNRLVPIELRPALDHDFEYCRRLYFDEMRWIIEELRLAGCGKMNDAT